jgi:hypothetical protein
MGHDGCLKKRMDTRKTGQGGNVVREKKVDFDIFPFINLKNVYSKSHLGIENYIGKL